MARIRRTTVCRHLLMLVLFAAAQTANGHFVFVVPSPDQKSAGVFLSEELTPDAEIKADLVAGAKLVVTDDAGHDTPVVLKPGDHGFTIDLPGKKTRVVHGSDSLGVTTRGSASPYLLTYYPKTIIGNPFDPKTRLTPPAPVELVPTGAAGGLKLLLLADGKPLPASQITVIFPDGTGQTVTTDSAGEVGPFTAPGRYGAWARRFTAVAGDRDGKHFDQTRDYATLVIDAPAPVSKTAYPPIPQKASSFGAIAAGGYLYVYGGHVADTHEYSTASVSGQFARLNLADPRRWEPLPAGPSLQGMNLATHGGKIYRVGGMSPTNKEGEPENVRSVADCAVFDPATGAWTALPPMPKPRSSHDVTVVGDTLFVIGGWTLTGDADAAKWFDTALMMDLSADKPVWKKVPQPFQRRAMTAAAFQGRVYVIGGFQTESEPSLEVDIFDPKTAAWSKGPDLPGPEMNGFGPAGCADGDTLYASVADGSFLALNKAGDGWDRISRTSPRIVHRIVPAGRQVLVIGGAAGQKQTDLIEAVEVKPAKNPTTAPVR